VAHRNLGGVGVAMMIGVVDGDQQPDDAGRQYDGLRFAKVGELLAHH
jgi:hypothetical protein